MTHTLHLGDCRTVLATLDDASIDAIVCDPPYELNFMGRTWDNSGIAYDVTVWQQCLRVLKPGGHLVAFGGSRTYHRLAVAIEDAGFEIRDQIQWIYAQGFPKSLDVSKAMDKQAGAVRDVVGNHPYANRGTAQSLQSVNLSGSPEREQFITAPATDLAKQWQGWGSNLKPAHEPAVLARKPLCGTVADNVRTWGVGAINVDATRIGYANDDDKKIGQSSRGSTSKGMAYYADNESDKFDRSDRGHITGRWPANVILDEDAATALDMQSGGNVSRFFYTVPNEYLCPLCYNTYAKDITAEDICKNIIANNAEKHGWTTPATNAFIAHVIALLRQNAQLAQNAKSAIPQCDLCATSIAVALAAIKTLGFNQQKCELILAYMPKFASSILIQNLVSFAELWGNIDTTPTTQNLLMLYGSALHAIENYTKQEGKEKVVGGNDPAKATRFLYTAKASKSEREAGLYYEEWVKAGAMSGAEYRQDRPTNHPQRANHHPTVKPLSLMRYLVRLVTPKGGKVLDPFMGSGSTGCAAVLEGCDFVGIDITPEYVAIAQKRIAHYAVESPLEGMLQ
jgi:DNA modification methylase